MNQAKTGLAETSSSPGKLLRVCLSVPPPRLTQCLKLQFAWFLFCVSPVALSQGKRRIVNKRAMSSRASFSQYENDLC